MKTDKNTIIGFVLLFILFVAFFWVTSRQQNTARLEKQHIEDSIAKLNASKIKPIDTAAARIDSLHADSVGRTMAAGSFSNAGIGTEQLTVVENDLMKVTFSNKGGQPKSIELKNYHSQDGKDVVLAGGKDDVLGYPVNTSANVSAQSYDLYFSIPNVVKNNDGSQTISYTLASSTGQAITHQFIIKKDDYLIDWNIQLSGADKLLTQNLLNINWITQLHQQESSAEYERTMSEITCFYPDDGYDYWHVSRTPSVDLEKQVSWVGFKQQFFNQTILAKDKFKRGNVKMNALADSTKQLYTGIANMQLQVPASASVTVPLQLYFGPSDYHIMKKYDNGMNNIVDMGSGIWAFVKYINRGVIMPVFDFLLKLVSNYGWAILLLTLFIRLITSPLVYGSYLSGSKMRVLRPELDELKKKFGDDQQGFAMEQMKLFREAGVNPMGGCIPSLLQVPIFFALYSFFNSYIGLRGQSFLWAKDLSTYDVVAHLPFTIPMFGNHISLFALTAVIASFMISMFNMSMTPTQSNPAMKYMPYIMLVFMLLWFNRLPAALTWYYTISNTITLLLQFIIQKYIINHEKILAQIDEKRKAPKKTSKWQERLAQMQEQQKKMQEMKNKR